MDGGEFLIIHSSERTTWHCLLSSWPLGSMPMRVVAMPPPSPPNVKEGRMIQSGLVALVQSCLLGLIEQHARCPFAFAPRQSVAQDRDVLTCEAKARKLLIIKLPEPCTYALLPRIVPSLGESTHQARSGSQASGRTR